MKTIPTKFTQDVIMKKRYMGWLTDSQLRQVAPAKRQVTYEMWADTETTLISWQTTEKINR